MNNQEFSNLNEKKTEDPLDKALIDVLPEIPPNNILEKVIPCRRAMNYIIAGFALSAIKINVFALNYIAVTVGYFLLFLGFRTLKHENKWFKYCWGASIVQNVLQIFNIGISSTIYRGAFSESLYGLMFIIVNSLTWILMLFFFAQGLKALQKKAGVKVRKGSVAAIIIWYLAVYFLSIIKVMDGIVFIIILALFAIIYIFILRGFYRISKELYASGYAIRTEPFRVSDKWFGAAFTVIVAVIVSCGFMFFSSFPMEWTPVPENEHSEVEDIKAQLIELGFPEDVLNDISEEDIKACEGAVGVKVIVNEHPVNEGRVVEENDAGTIRIETVYDEKELVSTNIVVKLPGEGKRLKVFHHFYWRTDPGFRGTETIEMWLPAKIVRAGCKFSGRVLYDNDGVTYVSPYYAVKDQTYTSLINRQTMSTFYDFSMPKEGENKRCYVSCEFIQLEDYMNTQANYYHQKTLLQYPVYTASEYAVNFLGSNSTFRRVQAMTEIIKDDFTDETQPSSEE